MKIAYATVADSRNIRSWSGTMYYIGKSLEEAGCEVERIGPLVTPETLGLRLRRRFYTKCLGQSFLEDRDPSVVKSYARQVSEALARMRPEVVLGTHTETLAYLETDLPVVYWTDSSFAGMRDFYPWFSNLCRPTAEHGMFMEQQALRRCRLAIYSSDWAARTAIEHCGADPRKVKVVPYGANIVCTRTAADIERLIARRPADECRLLFIGRIWERKGGPLVLEVARQLNAAGLRTTLTLVGSEPPGKDALPAYVRCMGFINKSTPEGRDQFNQLMAESHFFIVPSRAEAYGIVFCEASSFGIPSLTTNVGGIPTVVRDDRNGKTFPLEAPADAYAGYIRGLMRDFPRYQQLSRSAFAEYETRLNWKTAAREVLALLHHPDYQIRS